MIKHEKRFDKVVESAIRLGADIQGNEFMGYYVKPNEEFPQKKCLQLVKLCEKLAGLCNQKSILKFSGERK